VKVGDVAEWMDQGPAILLEEVEIPAPCTEEQLEEFLSDPDAWPLDCGWKIKLLLTGEILDVHVDTLDADFIFKPEGILH
jgi:hypothetical protein